MTRDFRIWRPLACLAAAAVLSGCTRPEPPPRVPPLATLPPGIGAAAPRLNGSVGTTDTIDRSLVNAVPPRAQSGGATPPAIATTGGNVSLDFADTDIREVTAQILGNLLHVTYTIDPAVHGTATLHTATPLPRSDLLPTLQVLLSQDGATLVRSGAMFRILPAAAAATTPGLATSPGDAGNDVIPLRYASADELARVLQPFAGPNARIAAEGGSTIVLAGEPVARAALANLVRAFDVDSLASQSFALLPVGQGNAREVATALQQALDVGGSAGAAPAGGNTPALAAATGRGGIRVVAMERINSVLVSAPDPRLIDQARRVFTLVQRRRAATVRTWTVYFLQNGRSNDVAYVLQQAFTPDHVTAHPTETAQLRQIGASGGGQSGGGIGGAGQGGLGSGGVGGIGGGSLGGLGSSGGGLGSGSIGGGSSQAVPARRPPEPHPIRCSAAWTSPAAGTSNADEMRIIPNTGNNALLIYGTPQELDTVQAMLHRIDILPLQVRIDAVIAEVELNDALQYDTQFFFKSGRPSTARSAQVFNATTCFAGLFSSPAAAAAQVALNLLQSVSTVHVLSSPELHGARQPAGAAGRSAISCRT